jgi:hypothetical protein
MAKDLNIGFTINAPTPIDSRMQAATYAGLSSIPVVYVGLKCYVVDVDKEYRYYETGWQLWSTTTSSGGGGSWGSITGVLADQADLNSALFGKFDKTGGIISGDVIVTAFVEAYNFVTFGSEPTAEFPYLTSHIVGEPTGSSVVQNIVFISAADHAQAVIDATLVTGTHYVIT